MKTAYIHSPFCMTHDTGAQHVENRLRLAAIDHALMQDFPDTILPIEAQSINPDYLGLAHSAEYIDHVFSAFPSMGRVKLDGDTIISSGSADAVLYATGAVIDAVDLVLDGAADNAFCAVRPPGHHAHYNHAAGFCIFNNVAIGALYALQHRGLDRVAIFDFDIHHGDGTQNIVENNPNIFFASTYEIFPQYAAQPDTHHETGLFNTMMFRGFPPKATGQDVIATWRDEILPAAAEFKPQMVFLSAGFDSHIDDPLGHHRFQTKDYADLMQCFKDFAKEICENRLVAVLEGGYNPVALAQSVVTSLRVLSL